MNAKPTALLISPHLDDVAFSCGGLAALLADRGWHTVLATVFTRSVMPATGFALACQLDKGLPAETDYMALRRDEDLQAAAILSCGAVRWLDLPEAPHRFYRTAAALFGAVHDDDPVLHAVTGGLADLATSSPPNLVLAPQGLGNHVDHQIVVTAVQAVFPERLVAYYRDTPYAIRQPQAAPLACVPAEGLQVIDIGAALSRKIGSAIAYASQTGFQFGGPEACAQALAAFAYREGGGVAAERFTGAALPI